MRLKKNSRSDSAPNNLFPTCALTRMLRYKKLMLIALVEQLQKFTAMALMPTQNKSVQEWLGHTGNISTTNRC